MSFYNADQLLIIIQQTHNDLLEGIITRTEFETAATVISNLKIVLQLEGKK